MRRNSGLNIEVETEYQGNFYALECVASGIARDAGGYEYDIDHETYFYLVEGNGKGAGWLEVEAKVVPEAVKSALAGMVDDHIDAHIEAGPDGDIEDSETR
jgi:hypothetical protein